MTTKPTKSRTARRAANKTAAAAAQKQVVSLKAGSVFTFSPPGSEIVYRFRVLDLSQRAEYRRDMRAKGCIPPNAQEVNAILREGIDAHFSGTEADRMHLVIDELEQLNEDITRALGSGNQDAVPELQARAKRVKAGWMAINYRVRKIHQPLADLDGDIQYARDNNNLVVLRWTLIGWENYTRATADEGVREPVPFEVDAEGKPTALTLTNIPQEHFYQVTEKAYDMVQLGQATIKN